MSKQLDTVWVFGDQLNRRIGALSSSDPKTHEVLMVGSSNMLAGRDFHRQRIHLVLTSMRRFAAELADAGYQVDYWDFLDRHREVLKSNARMFRQYANLDRLPDMDDVRERAREAIDAIEAGEI